jgi:hypothetical protein
VRWFGGTVAGDYQGKSSWPGFQLSLYPIVGRAAYIRRVGLFSRRGKKAAQWFAVVVESQRDQEVVGEAQYQGVLERLAGGRSDLSANVPVSCVLLPEPHNPHDANAVAIQVDGATVGYLPRKDAAAFSPCLRAALVRHEIVQCSGLIVGGWENGPEDRGHFGIWLRLPDPADLEQRLRKQ